MTALTTDRNTKSRDGKTLFLPVAAGVTIYQGALVALENGYAVPAKTASGLKGLGRAKARADNSAGAAGEVGVEIEKGVFLFENDITNTCSPADIGAPAYAVDDQTVANTDGAGTRSAVGVIFDVDSAGVWVKF
tara:strand:- start:1582 stop:1983 length:402 start_codon:yes stop_codon:yes gene_type:complete